MAEIIADAREVVEDVAKAAFHAGVRHGRKEVIEKIQERFAGLFEDDLFSQPVSNPADAIVTAMEDNRRAAQGSVKPAIEKMLVAAEDGITATEIAQNGAFKHNTVRGTLWTLSKEGFAKSHHGRWYAIKENAPSNKEDAFS